MTLGRACDHTGSRRGLWDQERGQKWGGWRRVVEAGCCLVPSLNAELQRLPTEPQAKDRHPSLPCHALLPQSSQSSWILFLDLRLDRLVPVWTGKPVLDISPAHNARLSLLSLSCRNPGPGWGSLSRPLSTPASAQPLSSHQTCSARQSWAQGAARFSGPCGTGALSQLQEVSLPIFQMRPEFPQVPATCPWATGI